MSNSGKGDLNMKKHVLFRKNYGINLVNFLTNFGIFLGQLVYFFHIWYIIPKKFWQPCSPPLLPAQNTNTQNSQSRKTCNYNFRLDRYINANIFAVFIKRSNLQNTL
jgi:hypothetical protein